MSENIKEPLFGSTPMTQAFAKYRTYEPIASIARYPGKWSELLNRASLAQTVDDLSEEDATMLADAMAKAPEGKSTAARKSSRTPGKKVLEEREVKTIGKRRAGLRKEPYKPDAVDADKDGIVQEGTAWERPGGTQLIDAAGRAIQAGATSAQRPQGMRVQRDGKDVDYTPTYNKPDSGSKAPKPAQRTEKPAYPRKPPASAFSGKAAEVFGSAKSWKEFWERMKDEEIVFLDYETTGLEEDKAGRPSSNGLPTQIGAVKMKNGQVIDRFNVYINPGRPFSKWTQWSQENLRDQDGNPITQEFLEDKPTIAEAHRMLAEWIGADAIMGAQNVVFDEEVLLRSLEESGIDWRPAGWLDTKEIADMTLPRWSEDSPDGPVKVNKDGTKSPSSSLAHITQYLGVELGKNHHTADHDAVATGEVLNRIVRGGIEKGWSADVLDADKRKAKEQKNQDDFARASEVFEKQLEEYNETHKPSWSILEDILDFRDLVGNDEDDWSLGVVADEVGGDWNDWDPCREIRAQAYRIAGLVAGPEDPNISRSGGYWGNGAFPRQPGDPNKRYEQAKYLMGSLGQAVHRSPDSDRPTLYRAMDLSPTDTEAFWGVVKPGEQIDVPLLAFADRRNQGYKEFLSDYGKDVLLVLDESPGSVEIGRFSPMWSQDEEDASLDNLVSLADEIESLDEDEEELSFATQIRELVEGYRATSLENAERRQELRDELTSIASDYGIPVDWAGDDIEGDNAWDLENSPLHSPRERVSGGRMEVVSVSDDPAGVYGRVVVLRQIGAFDPQVPGRLIKRRL